MKKLKKTLFSSLFMLSCCLTSTTRINADSNKKTVAQQEPTITKIVIEGNKYVSDEAVKKVLSFRLGKLFKTEDAAHNIRAVNAMGWFDPAKTRVEKEVLSGNKVALFVIVQEKFLLTGYDFTGNKAVATKKLEEALGLKEVKAVTQHDLQIFKKRIELEYRNINYFDVQVKAALEADEAEEIKQAVVRFEVVEGDKTRLSRVHFAGCDQISESQIRNNILTREDWLLSALDGSGRFSPDMLEQDKHLIEEFYQNKGYLKAKVVDAVVEENTQTKSLEVTFVIEEGQRFKVRFTSLPIDDEFDRDKLKKALTIKRGEFYSRKKLVSTMERLKVVFGSRGYIYCDVFPDISPDEKNGLVDIDFNIEKGKKYYINDIKITGNQKTKDRVIRRELAINEGDLATKAGMDISQRNVEALGYFDRNYIDWKTKRVDDNKVDLELNVKETRTGQGAIGLTLSPDGHSDKSSTKFTAELKKRNFAGCGWDVEGDVQMGGLKTLRTAHFNFGNPYIFDHNLSFSVNAYLTNFEYERQGGIEFKGGSPLEKTTGLVARFGFAPFMFDQRVKMITELGVENLDFDQLEIIGDKRGLLKKLVERDKFKDGTIGWFGYRLLKDTLNNPMYPDEGWKAEFSQRYSLPGVNKEYNFLKTELNGSLFFPLVKKERLTLGLHGKIGYVEQLTENKPIPYKELYHVGGPNSIRGFRWGEAGPTYKNTGYPLGAKGLCLVQCELITPLALDDQVNMQTPRGYLFYDIGTGWDTPKPELFDEATQTTLKLTDADVKNDDFFLRHTIGFGFRMTAPTPLKVEVGYKLNRLAGTRERPSEMHISMNTMF